MLIEFPRAYGGIGVGRDYRTGCPSFALFWSPRHNAQPGELRFRFELFVALGWPRLISRPHPSPSGFVGEFSSTRWTGRSADIVGVRWPRRFWFHREATLG